MEANQRRKADVLIVTVKRTELDAAQQALGIAPDEPAQYRTRGIQFWECNIAREAAPPVSAILTMVGQAGNAQMSAFLHTALSTCDVKLSVLLGMAAGNPELVEFGDVVFSNQVVDCGRRILTEGGALADLATFKMHPLIARDLMHFEPVRRQWYEVLAEHAETAFSQKTKLNLQFPAGFEPSLFRPKYRQGTILAADELIEDGSITARALQVASARRGLAAEMEGAGFAITCDEADIPWLIARGIADLGDKHRSKEWQYASTLAAATAVERWLRTSLYLTPGGSRE